MAVFVLTCAALCAVSAHGLHLAPGTGQGAALRVGAPRRAALRAAAPQLDDASATARSPAGARAQPARAERLLGSMENLFAPRQPGGLTTSSTPHVAVATLDAPLSDTQLQAAVRHAIATQPMLRRRIVGDGQPASRTRLGDFKVFVPMEESAVLALEQSALNLEFGEFELENGPLWRLSVLRSDKRTALVFALNHTVSRT
ncbi:hypothetical protein T492DRAFT_865276 [Pavlovales sp. CCMP2436]|nr:hypothetical protein T492DRAFT_865276 [Pavlovales sp. CCMP2436]